MRRAHRRKFLAVISLVKELGVDGGDGGDGGDGDGENGGDGGDGGEEVEEPWPPIGWEDPPGIFPPLTPDHPIVRLEGEDAPPAGAVWPRIPVSRGRFAALVEAGDYGNFVVVLDATKKWPEKEEEEEEAEAHKP
jgi:hypothetical protein